MARNVACRIICLSLATLMMALFAYTAANLVQHTPVYTPLECVTVSTEYGELAMDDNFANTSGTSVKRCRNPNPFNMRLYQGQPSKVWVKDALFGYMPVGKSIMHDSTFMADSEGTGSATLEISLTIMQAFMMMSAPKVAVVAEVNAVAEAEMSFLGASIKVAEESSKVCGFEMAMVPEQKAGPSACADTRDELVIPDIDAEAETVDRITMSPEQLAYHTRQKNVSFGILLSVFGGLAIALLTCGVLAGGRGRGRSGEDGVKDAREVKVEVPATAGQAPPVLLGTMETETAKDQGVTDEQKEGCQVGAEATEGAESTSI